jgi:hypothetical protein
MHNCPDRFYLNCSEAQVSCKVCAAGRGGPKLKYKPIKSEDKEGDLLNHPWCKDKSKVNIQKRAKTTEKKQRENIARATIRSGALLGDGDTHLLNGKLKLETKDRGVKSSWCLSLSEYNKGLRQGIDIYGITITPPNLPRRLKQSSPKTLYIIDENLLGIILHLISST